ncbi:MAG: hypothetical protein H5T73_01125 [Actinobacteria bacterium]|nr:hypothetical protein [Actinomycetota bacterium]
MKKPGMRFMAALLAALALAAAAPPVPGRAAQAPSLLFRVDLSEGAVDSLSVTLELEGESGVAVLRMEDSYGEGLAADLSSHVCEERATDASGRELPIRREGNTWYMEHDGKASFSYRVRLSGYEAGTTYISSLAASGARWPYFPFLEGDLAYLPGYAVFVRPDLPPQTPVDLEVLLPEGWTTAVPRREGPHELGELLSDPLLAGEITVLEREGLVLALPSASSPAAGTLEEFADKVASALDRLRSVLASGGEASGEASRDGVVLVALLRGEGDRVEDVFFLPEPFSHTAVLAAPAGVDILSDACLEASVREAASLLLRRSLLLQPEARWLLEGAAWYLQGLLPYRAGTWGGALFWDRFSRRYQLYREAAERKPVSLAQAGFEANADGDAAAVLICGGAAACAALDAELHALQPQELDLVSFLARLAEMGGEEGGLGNADIRSLLETLSGRDWSSFFRGHIEGTRVIPASAFSSLRVAAEETPSLPTRGSGESTSVPEWILLAVAVALVLLIPFLMEPYTMRPRKPGFLEKKLREED